MCFVSKELREAATTLIANVMERHGLTSIEELTCPDMRALAEALQPLNGIVNTKINFFRVYDDSE